MNNKTIRARIKHLEKRELENLKREISYIFNETPTDAISYILQQETDEDMTQFYIGYYQALKDAKKLFQDYNN